MSIIEIDKKCHLWSKCKTPIELVYDKLIMSRDGLHISNSTLQIDHPKCTMLEKDTIVLDDVFHHYFEES